MTTDDPTPDMNPDAMANAMTDETLAATGADTTDEMSGSTVAEVPVDATAGDASGAEPRDARPSVAIVLDGLRRHPRRRLHGSPGRQRFTTGAPPSPAISLPSSPEIGVAADAPEAGDGVGNEPAASGVAPPARRGRRGRRRRHPRVAFHDVLPGYVNVVGGDFATGRVSPSGPVTGYHPGRLAGILPSGAIIHAHYNGEVYLGGAHRPERQEAARPEVPRVEASLGVLMPLSIESCLRHGESLFESGKPRIRDLAQRFPRIGGPSRREGNSDRRLTTIDYLASLNPLSALLASVARDPYFATWVAADVLRNRYGHGVTMEHVRDVVDLAITWLPTGEAMAIDAYIGEYGVPEPLFAVGDVAHVRQEIMRRLMSVACTARGLIQGRGETALLAFAAALDSGHAATMSLLPGRSAETACIAPRRGPLLARM